MTRNMHGLDNFAYKVQGLNLENGVRGVNKDRFLS